MRRLLVIIFSIICSLVLESEAKAQTENCASFLSRTGNYLPSAKKRISEVLSVGPAIKDGSADIIKRIFSSKLGLTKSEHIELLRFTAYFLTQKHWQNLNELPAVLTVIMDQVPKELYGRHRTMGRDVFVLVSEISRGILNSAIDSPTRKPEPMWQWDDDNPKFNTDQISLNPSQWVNFYDVSRTAEYWKHVLESKKNK